MSDIREQLEESQKVCSEATEGPWIAEYSSEQGDCVIPGDAQSTREALAVTRLYRKTADATFIAHARTTLPLRNAQLAAVLKVHEPIDALNVNARNHHKVQVCTGCGQDDGNWNQWPCPTIRAIEDAAP